MATEEEKKKNLLRLIELTLLGLSTGVWDLLGESSLGLSHQIGSRLLPILEQEMGLEITGEEPEHVLQEIGRLFVDEFGFSSKVEVKREGDTITMLVHSCVNRAFTDKLVEVGVTTPFTCPYLAISNFALNQMGMKARSNVTKWVEGKGSILTFELV